MRNCAVQTAMPLSLMRIGLRFMQESIFQRISTTTPACNIPNLEMIFSDAFRMPEENDVLPEKKWIAQLIQPGTSLGGARPKTGVLDEKGCL